MSLAKRLLLHAPPLYEAVQRWRDTSEFRRCERRGSFAQHGEDRELLRLLSQAGTHAPYLDLGCNHPFRLSNSFLLYREGWRGVCVDPLPRFARLYRRWRPEDDFRCVAVGERAGSMTLHEFESDVLSTLDAALAASYVAAGYRLRRRLAVPVMRADELLAVAALQPPLSLLSIDLEGHELQALRSLDLRLWRPALVCVESLTASGQRNDGAIEHLVAHGYRLASDLGLNLVFAAPSPPG